MIIFVRFLLGFMLVFTSLFLILLVLIQRGRGGGLAGALGGMGGQSAFGAKAGDVFTKITIGVAAFWIVLCIISVNVLGRQQSLLSGELGGSAPISLDATTEGGDEVPGDGEAGAEGDAASASEPAASADGSAGEAAADGAASGDASKPAETAETPAEPAAAGE